MRIKRWIITVNVLLDLLDPESIPNCYKPCYCYQIFENSLRLCEYAADLI